MNHGFNDETKEKVEVPSGRITKLTKTVTVPATTYGYNIDFNLSEQPEYAEFDNYILLDFYQDNAHSPMVVGGGSQSGMVYPRMFTQTVSNSDYVMIGAYNSSSTDKSCKFGVTILWYND
jgi:hypothetical protein